MTVTGINTIALVVLGVVLLSGSIAGAVRLRREVPLELRWRWLAMIVFIVFFDLGYLAFVFLIVTGTKFPIELLAGLILLGGAIFVYLFLKLSEFTISRMRAVQEEANAANEQLRQTNRDLAGEVREREAVSQELRRSKVELENILNNSIPICITNIHREIVNANEAYWQIFGRPVPQIVQKCYESRPGSTCRTRNCPFTQVMAGAREVVCESKKTNPDGSESYFMVTARPYRDENGEIVGIVESFQDVTDLKNTEEALAAEKERLLVTLKSIADGVIAADLRGRVVLINDTAQDLTGWTRPYAAGRKAEDILHLVDEKDRRLLLQPIAQVLHTASAEEAGRRAVLIARDGWERRVNYSVSPIHDRKREMVGVILVFQDITEKLQAEAEIDRSQKLESIGLLAGGIAHDFNNILAAVMNNLALARLVTDQREKLLERLESTEKAIYRARELTGQLLTFAKGGAPLKKVISIADLTRDSVEFSLRGSNVAANFQIEEGLWPVEVDSVQMHQVFSNLTINADQAMPDGGNLTIGLSNWTVEEGESAPMPPGRYVKITLADNGPGIEERHLARIFDPYFTTKPSGTGLGLATVHSIVSRHGGHLLVDSLPGQGSVFSIYLPAAQMDTLPPVPLRDDSSPVEVDVTGSRILVMDDDREIRELLQELLQQEGYRPDCVADGAAAIQAYRQALKEGAPYGCVIMDLTIPGGMGGKEAISQLRMFDPGVRAIVSSGYSNDPVMAEFSAHGFKDRLAKPYLLEDLVAVLKQVLNS
jgi:PAS domain S-box-containing protein